MSSTSVHDDDFAKAAVVVGDQQVYAIMKNLKAKNPYSFQWLYPVPGGTLALHENNGRGAESSFVGWSLT